QGGDSVLVFGAVDILDGAFVVDPLPLKVDGIVACSPRTANASAALIATRLAVKAKAVADPLRNEEVKSTVAAREKSVAQLQKEFTSIAAYAKTLSDKPEDPASNKAMGLFYCLVKEDWDRGLPMLARGNDAILKGLAEKELSKPADDGVQKDLCEGWLALAEKEAKGPKKDNLTERARLWFNQVEDKLLPADKTRISKKLETLEKAAAPKPALAKKPANKAPAIPA